MHAKRYIDAQKAKKNLRRKASKKEKYIATSTFAAGKALRYGIIGVNELAMLRGNYKIFSEDFVVRGTYLITWNGKVYRILNGIQTRKFPIIINPDEYRRRTGQSVYDRILLIKSCR